MPPSEKNKNPRANKPQLAPKPDAVSEIVINPENGQVLYSRNADERRDPASLTKLMTAYVVMNAIKEGRLNLDQEITISPGAAALENNTMLVSMKNPDGTTTDSTTLPTGSKLTVREALVVMMTASANGVAKALAEATPIKQDSKGKWVPGTETEFAAEMNRYAAEFDMKNTRFINASGRNDGGTDLERNNVSTARDMAVLASVVMKKFPEFEGILAKDHASTALRLPNGQRANIGSATTNKFVADFGLNDPSAVREGFHAAGIQKTGTNNLTGGINLIATAEDTHGVRLTSVVMGAKSTEARYSVNLRNLRTVYQDMHAKAENNPAMMVVYTRPEVRDVSAVSTTRMVEALEMRKLRGDDGKSYQVKSELVIPRMSGADYEAVWHQAPVSAASDQNLGPAVKALSRLGWDFRGKPPADFTDRRLKQALTSFKYQVGLPNPEKAEFDTVTAKYLTDSAKRADQFIARQKHQELDTAPIDLVKRSRELGRRDAPEEDKKAFSDYVVGLKQQLNKAGLLPQPTKQEWERDDRGRRKGKPFTVDVPFNDRVDGNLLKAFGEHQRRSGLKETNGKVDKLSAQLLAAAAKAPAVVPAPSISKPPPAPVAPAVKPLLRTESIPAAIAPQATVAHVAAPKAAEPLKASEVVFRMGNKSADKDFLEAQKLLARLAPKYKDMLGKHGVDGFYGKDSDRGFAAYATDNNIRHRSGEITRDVLNQMQQDRLALIQMGRSPEFFSQHVPAARQMQVDETRHMGPLQFGVSSKYDEYLSVANVLEKRGYLDPAALTAKDATDQVSAALRSYQADLGLRPSGQLDGGTRLLTQLDRGVQVTPTVRMADGPGPSVDFNFISPEQARIDMGLSIAPSAGAAPDVSPSSLAGLRRDLNKNQPS